MPVAIFPGGTANVMSLELGIPADPVEACALVTAGRSSVRAIDVGKIGDRIFLTRVGMGLEGNVIEATDREQKDRMGWVAYALNTFRELTDPKISRYRLTLDGQIVETEGILCFAANSGIFSANTGGPPLTFSPRISVADGLLDVMVIRRADVGSLLRVAASILSGSDDAEPLQHWQVTEATIEADPPQLIQLDGEVLPPAVVHVRAWPHALRVIVPASAQPATPATRDSLDAQAGTANSGGDTSADACADRPGTDAGTRPIFPDPPLLR
jgi:diacylglycerol kinase (ATP)